MSTSATTQARPDLIPTDLRVTNSVKAPQPLTLHLEVKNQGAFTVNTPWAVAIVVHSAHGSMLFIKVFPWQKELEPGESHIQTEEFAELYQFPVGDYSLSMLVDCFNTIEESNEFNNSLGPIQFTLTNDSIPSSPREEEQESGNMNTITDHYENEYVEIPSGIGKRHEPVIRGKGVPVWVLVSYATKRNMTIEQISQIWDGYITAQEVQGALDYWRARPELVEDKLTD